MTAPKPSLAERTVTKVASFLDRRRPSRRDFLAGVAVVGSAVAIDPWGFLVEDAAAYDVVCGQGADCNSGWTAFCCSVAGKNSCPPGTYPAGWWKADNSGFCCGKPRYYIDCNRKHGDPRWQTPYCATGGCDRRAVATNHFRYGNCHLEVPALAYETVVVCRVVTCMPPWEWDPACSRSSRTSNATATHNAPCLTNDCSGEVEKLWTSLGGAGGVLGRRTAQEAPTPPRGFRTLYANGAIYRENRTVREVHGSIWSVYRALGSHTGVLGYPTTSTFTTAGGGSRMNKFDDGGIVATPGRGTFVLFGPVYAKWLEFGATRLLGAPTTDSKTARDGVTVFAKFVNDASIFHRPDGGTYVMHGIIHRFWFDHQPARALGYPTSDTLKSADGKSVHTKFDHGIIVSTNGGTPHMLMGPVYEKWSSLGSTRLLGAPTTDSKIARDGVTVFAKFVNDASIFHRPDGGTYVMHGIIHRFWFDHQPARALGYPTSDTLKTPDGRGVYTEFDHGILVSIDGGTPFMVMGPVYDKWQAMGGFANLGAPLTDSKIARDGVTVFAKFQNGSIFHRPDGGTWEMHGTIHHFWFDHPEARPLGYPISDTGTDGDGNAFSRFDNGRIVVTSSGPTIIFDS